MKAWARKSHWRIAENCSKKTMAFVAIPAKNEVTMITEMLVTPQKGNHLPP
jgi:hypothetical protein